MCASLFVSGNKNTSLWFLLVKKRKMELTEKSGTSAAPSPPPRLILGGHIGIAKQWWPFFCWAPHTLHPYVFLFSFLPPCLRGTGNFFSVEVPFGNEMIIHISSHPITAGVATQQLTSAFRSGYSPARVTCGDWAALRAFFCVHYGKNTHATRPN